MSPATAILFPGQGSQRDGMGDLVSEVAPDLRELLLAEVGEDPFPRAGESTRFAQPAILCAGLALWIAAGRPAADAFAGHSLGELGAAAAAGAISPEDAVRLAAARGRLMDEAAEATPGTMLALLCSADDASELAAATGTTVANDNAPTQVVLSGGVSELRLARSEAKERGIRSIELPVAGAFHSPAMKPAYEPFRDQLATIDVSAPSAMLLSAVTVAPLETPEEIRDALARGIVEPVRWREAVEELHRRGVERYLETGPGKTLTGMVRRTLDGVEAAVLSPAGALSGGADA